MKRKRLSTILGSVCLVLVLAALLLPACAKEAPAPAVPTPTTPVVPTPTPTPAWQPSGKVSCILTSTASAGYQSGSALLATLEGASGVTVSFIPGAKTMDRTVALKKEQVDFAWYTAADCIFAMEGIYDFEPAEWGPQSIRTAWVGGLIPQGPATRADSGIKTWSDLVGRRVTSYPTHISGQFFMDACMAYGNLSWDDVISTPASGWGPAQLSIIDGSSDLALMSAQAAQAYEADSSIHGLYWIPMPNKTAEDKAAWARFWEVCPALFPSAESDIAAATLEKPADIYGYNYHIVTYDWQDENLVYWLVKQMAENYDAYKDKHAFLKRWSLDHCLDYNMWYVPWHQGAIEYFKDIGRWTPAMEAKQQEMVGRYPQTMTK